jgi:hypothetical protein
VLDGGFLEINAGHGSDGAGTTISHDTSDARAA